MAPTPIAFLVSTTPNAPSIRAHLGSPAYSYYFVLEALAPVLDRLGRWTLIDRPESRLAFAAARAEADGFRPIHLAINPLQDAYLSPALPNVVFPFWEFPDIPGRDFGHDTRQNWARVARRADLILTACRFTADAFRRAGVATPVEVVPVPLDPSAFAVPDWDPRHVVSLTCRHATLRPPDPMPIAARSPSKTGPARAAFRKVAPWLRPETVRDLVLLKRRVVGLARQSPKALAYRGLRAVYRRSLKRWLGPAALERVSSLKDAALARAGHPPTEPIDPLLPSGPLTLSGLVYTTILNLGDRRKNLDDLLSAYLLAFRDRPDATLVIKLTTNPRREHHEVSLLRDSSAALGLDHACRVVAITEYLDESQMADLFRATTYYLNASHAEGACLPLQRALAAGRPAVAPDHTAMADYLDDSLAFVVRSHPEPTHWPHDPDERIETLRYRLVWSDLKDRLLASARVADSDPFRYAAMASAARRRMATIASHDAAAEAMRSALDRLANQAASPGRASAV